MAYIRLKVNAKDVMALKNKIAYMPKILEKAGPKTTKDLAEKIRKYARRFAPSPSKSKISTGRLKDQISVHTLKDKTIVYSSARSHSRGDTDIYWGYPYAVKQETGTPRRRARYVRIGWKKPVMIFKSSETGEWMRKRTVAGIGHGVVGRRTIHYMTRAYLLVISRWEESLEYLDDPLKEIAK